MKPKALRFSETVPGFYVLYITTAPKEPPAVVEIYEAAYDKSKHMRLRAMCYNESVLKVDELFFVPVNILPITEVDLS